MVGVLCGGKKGRGLGAYHARPGPSSVVPMYARCGHPQPRDFAIGAIVFLVSSSALAARGVAAKASSNPE